jgi:hypothetical protein
MSWVVFIVISELSVLIPPEPDRFAMPGDPTRKSGRKREGLVTENMHQKLGGRKESRGKIRLLGKIGFGVLL